MEEKEDQSDKTNLNKFSFGFLYVITNPVMPGLVKVGQTERHPAARIEELSNHSGIPPPFILTFFIEVTDRLMAEQAVHRALTKYRVSPDREFFKLSLSDVQRVIYESASQFIPPSAARTFTEKGENMSKYIEDNSPSEDENATKHVEDNNIISENESERKDKINNVNIKYPKYDARVIGGGLQHRYRKK